MHINQRLTPNPLGDDAGGDLAGTYPNPTVAQASGAFSLTGIIKPVIASNQNDWNPTGLSGASTIQVDGGVADRTITGLQGGSSGRIVVIQNIGTTNSIILSNLDALSLLANRFNLGGSLSLEPGQGVILQYETTELWHAIQHQDPYGTTANTVCQGNDSRLSDSRTPTGAAAGDLAGTYPNPTVKASVGLTGTPTAPTAAPGTNTTQIATTAFVTAAITAGAYTDEQAQDAVGAALTDTASIDFTYTDGTNSITADVKTNAITDAMLRQGAACSVVGRSANSIGNVADIAIGTNDKFLVRRANVLLADFVTISDLPTLTSFTGADPALDDELAGYDVSAAANRKFLVNYLLALPQAPPGGRLTLTTGTWAPAGTVTGSTVYYTPGQTGGAGHNRISIYDGTRWRLYTFSEISVAVPSTQWRPFDIFVYDNAGTLTLETVNWDQLTGSITAATNASPIVVTSTAHGLNTSDLVFISGTLGNTGTNGAWAITKIDANSFSLQGSVGTGAWTSGGTWWKLNGSRATALATQDGVLVKSGATTRRYLGTGCTNGTSGTCEDSLLNRFLFNAYNPIIRIAQVNSASGHTYATNYTRYNGNDPTLHTKFVLGLSQDFLIGLFGQLTGNGTTGRAQTKVSADGLTAVQDNIVVIPAQAVNCSTLTHSTGFWASGIPAGIHFLPLHENSPDAVTVTIGISGIRTGLWM